MKQKIFLTCEHATNHIPRELIHYFNDKTVLKTHRAYDIGAEYVCSTLAKKLHLPSKMAEVSRLVVDLNRSLHHSALHSEFTRNVAESDKKTILAEYYLPFRHAVVKKISSMLKSCDRVIHVSVHSFTPVMNGVTRNTDIGLLYDPSRRHEKSFAQAWRRQLQEVDSAIRIRFNYPYKGVSDGFTTFLRKEFSSSAYVGIELEMNQSLLLDVRKRRVMSDWVTESLKRLK